MNVIIQPHHFIRGATLICFQGKTDWAQARCSLTKRAFTLFGHLDLYTVCNEAERREKLLRRIKAKRLLARQAANEAAYWDS